jgi:hypothetical protein
MGRVASPPNAVGPYVAFAALNELDSLIGGDTHWGPEDNSLLRLYYELARGEEANGVFTEQELRVASSVGTPVPVNTKIREFFPDDEDVIQLEDQRDDRAVYTAGFSEVEGLWPEEGDITSLLIAGKRRIATKVACSSRQHPKHENPILVIPTQDPHRAGWMLDLGKASGPKDLLMFGADLLTAREAAIYNRITFPHVELDVSGALLELLGRRRVAKGESWRIAEALKQIKLSVNSVGFLAKMVVAMSGKPEAAHRWEEIHNYEIQGPNWVFMIVDDRLTLPVLISYVPPEALGDLRPDYQGIKAAMERDPDEQLLVSEESLFMGEYQEGGESTPE